MKLVYTTISLIAGAQAVANLGFTEFQNWKLSHRKRYASNEEELARYANFLDNAKFINEHNARHAAGQETYTVTLNKFADMTNGELADMLLSKDADNSLHDAQTCPEHFYDPL